MNPQKRTNEEPDLDFESLNLQVGSRLQIEVVRDVKPIQAISSLIGYLQNEYLIVRIPDGRNSAVSFRIGDKITVRVFSGIKVCAFDATVYRIFDNPIYYMHISFPTHIRASNLRSALRVKATVPAAVTSTTGPANATAALRDLSIKGALVEAEQQCGEVGDRFKLAFVLPCLDKDAGEQIETEAIIRNVSVSSLHVAEGQSTYRYGVEFVSLSLLHKLVLQTYTYDLAFNDRLRLV